MSFNILLYKKILVGFNIPIVCLYFQNVSTDSQIVQRAGIVYMIFLGEKTIEWERCVIVAKFCVV